MDACAFFMRVCVCLNPFIFVHTVVFGFMFSLLVSFWSLCWFFKMLCPVLILQPREHAELWSRKSLGYWMHERFSPVSFLLDLGMRSIVG